MRWEKQRVLNDVKRCDTNTGHLPVLLQPDYFIGMALARIILEPRRHKGSQNLVPFHRRCFGMSNVEQGMSIEEGLVGTFNHQHSLLYRLFDFIVHRCFVIPDLIRDLQVLQAREIPARDNILSMHIKSKN